METLSGRRAKRGQSAVEFALILPVLLLLTLGVVDGARIFTSWIALNSGVSEAALYATTNSKVTHWCMDPSAAPTGSVTCPIGARLPGDPGAAPADAACLLISGPAGNWCADPDNIAYRFKVEASGLDTSQITMTPPTCTTDANVTVACTDSTAANVTIGASYRMNLLMPVIGSIMGSPLRMSAAATAPIIPATP